MAKGYDWSGYLQEEPLEGQPPFSPSSFGLLLLSVNNQTGAINLIGAEKALGNPGVDGYVLSSTAAGVRSWVAMTGGSGGDIATDTLWSAKGDLSVGTGSHTAARLAVGTNGYIITADSTQTTGLKWNARIANGNLPLGAQLYDNAGTPKLSADLNARKAYLPNGTTAGFDWSQTDRVYALVKHSFESNGRYIATGGAGGNFIFAPESQTLELNDYDDTPFFDVSILTPGNLVSNGERALMVLNGDIAQTVVVTGTQRKATINAPIGFTGDRIFSYPDASGTFAISPTAPTQTLSTQAGIGTSLVASNAVAGSTNAGAAAGGNLTLTAGNAARKTSGNANGGDIILTTGSGIGTGVSGKVRASKLGDISGALSIDLDARKMYSQSEVEVLNFSSEDILSCPIEFDALSIVSQTTIGLTDTSAVQIVSLRATSSTALTGNRVFTLDMVNADRTLKLTGNPTLADWFDQSVKTTTSPTFAGLTIASGSLTLSGNQSAAAWTTSGLRIVGVAGTLTDTTSSGTVAAAYTNKLGGNTIAASSATTFTNYVSSYFSDPVAGTNVTLTNKWALGADSLRVGTSNQLTVSLTGVLTATSPVFTTPSLGVATATNLIFTPATVTYGSTTNIDFNGALYQTVTLTGVITFTTTNTGAGKSVTVRIIGDGSQRALTFPGTWTFIGAAAPTALAASKTAILSLTAFGSGDSNVIAAYAVQP